MSKKQVDDIIKRIDDLERNVGSVMGELDLIPVSSEESCKNYSDGMKTPLKLKHINGNLYEIVVKNIDKSEQTE